MIDVDSLKITPKVRALLIYFLANEGKPLQRGKLLVDVWGMKPTTETRSVDTHVGWVRKAIRPFGYTIVHSQKGYTLVPPEASPQAE